MSQSLQCSNCLLKNENSWTCDAFPLGIPQPILRGEHDHLNAYPNDKGFRRVPIEWDSNGHFLIISPEEEAREIIEPIDLSARRDSEVAKLYQYYLLRNNQKWDVEEIKPDSSDFNDWDHYPTYTGKRVVVAREITRRINYAVLILKQPDSVFRDFQEQQNTKQKFVVEFWIGRILSNGKLFYVRLRIVNDTVHNISIARNLKELTPLLSDISGIRIYKEF